MSNDEQTFRFGSSDAEPRRLTSVDDLLGQLDCVTDPIAPEAYEDGYGRLMAWMAQDLSPEPPPATKSSGTSAKIIVLGGAQAGTGEFIRELSEIPPIATDPLRDELGNVQPESRLVFGRRTISEDIVLYLFTPQVSGLSAVWNSMGPGSIGAVVLADTRHLSDCFADLRYLEERDLPYVLAVSRGEGGFTYSEAEVRSALNVRADVPVTFRDSQPRPSAREVLITLITHALEQKRVAVDSSDLAEELSVLVLLMELEGLLR